MFLIQDQIENISILLPYNPSYMQYKVEYLRLYRISKTLGCNVTLNVRNIE